MLIRRLAVLAKLESSYGVDPTPSPSADAVVVENFQWSYPTELEDPEASAASMSPIAHVVKRRTAELSFDVPLKGSGTAGTAPEYAPILRACGFSETIDPGVSVLYKPNSTAHASVTIYANVDGQLFEVNGARGNVEVLCEVGDKARLRFSMAGKPVAPADVAFPTVSNTDATPPLRVQSLGFTWGGSALTIAGFSIDMGAKVEFGDDANATDGTGEAFIRSRLPVGTLSPELVAVASQDFWAQWSAGTQKAIVAALTGAAGNIVSLSVPRAVVREFQPGDRAGALIAELPFTCVGSASGDDEVAITFT